jgi:AcrR family transcriptional regulator
LTAETIEMPQRTVRRADKSLRRQELIDATIDSLAKRGYEATTTAVVADGAGLSRGIVNFHFESKDKLLVATLKYLSDEYRSHWRGAVKAAPGDPASRLWALVSADFDRKVCTRRKLAAWCAFWGEAKSRPTYRELCSANDEEYQQTVVDLCAALAGPGQDAGLIARGIVAMQEGLWLHLMMGPKEFGREDALKVARTQLASLFPRHFGPDGPLPGTPAGPPVETERAG